jgi:Flp pilus assembly protein TadD
MSLRRLLAVAALASGLLTAGYASAQERELVEAEALLKQKQPEEAIQRVDRYLANRPKDARARFLKGRILTEQGRTAEALAVFTDLTSDYPELPEPYNNLAVLHASRGDYEQARAALEMAVRVNPRFAIAYENLGDVYARMAGQSYDKAHALDKTNRSVMLKLKAVNEILSGIPRSQSTP